MRCTECDVSTQAIYLAEIQDLKSLRPNIKEESRRDFIQAVSDI